MLLRVLLLHSCLLCMVAAEGVYQRGTSSSSMNTGPTKAPTPTYEGEHGTAAPIATPTYAPIATPTGNGAASGHGYGAASGGGAPTTSTCEARLANVQTEVNFLIAERTRRSELPFMWSMPRPTTRDEECHDSCQSCVKDAMDADGDCHQHDCKLFVLNGNMNLKHNQCTSCANEELFVHAKTVYGGLAVGSCSATGDATGDPLFEFGKQRSRSDMGSIPTLIVNSCVKSECRCIVQRGTGTLPCGKMICNRLCYLGGDNTKTGYSVRYAPPRSRKASAGGGLVPGGRYVEASEDLIAGGGHLTDQRVVSDSLSVYDDQKVRATGIHGTVLHSHGSNGDTYAHMSEARCLFSKVVYCEANPDHNPEKCADGGGTSGGTSAPDTLTSVISRLENVLKGGSTQKSDEKPAPAPAPERDTRLGESNTGVSQWCAKEYCTVTKKAKCHAIMPYDTTGTREPTEEEKAECGKVNPGEEVCEPVLRMF